jgi:alpha-tubulin suppressor-like RCC1 family protein
MPHTTLRAYTSFVKFTSVATVGVLMSCAAEPSNSKSLYPLLSYEQVVGGSAHTCAILNGGSVKCWGLNNSGQLGLGDRLNRGDGSNEMGGNLPVVNLGTGKTVTQLAAGDNHTCAILNDGSVKCWGHNGSGQLGLGDNWNRGDGPNQMGDNLPTVNLGTSKTAVQIAANAQFTCAILNDGSVTCWGYNGYGALGLGNNTWSIGDEPNEMGDNLPTVDLGAAAVQISAGNSHTCVILNGGITSGVKCWGSNASGQLGLGDSSGNLRYRGDQPNEMGGSLPEVNVGTGRTAIALRVGVGHTCSILDNGSAKCWGYNSHGELGLGDTQPRGDGFNEMGHIFDDMGDNLPAIDLGANQTPVRIGLGDYHTCAILTDAGVKCWGFGTFGRLGLGDNQNRGDNANEMGDNLPTISLY